jgi:hypothetical protein
VKKIALKIVKISKTCSAIHGFHFQKKKFPHFFSPHILTEAKYFPEKNVNIHMY